MNNKEIEILRDLAVLIVDVINERKVDGEKFEKVEQKILDYDSSVNSINIRCMIDMVYDAVDREFADDYDKLLYADHLRILCVKFPDKETNDLVNRLLDEEFARRA